MAQQSDQHHCSTDLLLILPFLSFLYIILSFSLHSLPFLDNLEYGASKLPVKACSTIELEKNSSWNGIIIEAFITAGTTK
jgi:hypothetical protein